MELSLDAPELAKPLDVQIFELVFENINLLKSFLDLKIIGVPIDAIGEEETVEERMRFDQPIKIHELPPQPLVGDIRLNLTISVKVPLLAICSCLVYKQKRSN